MYSLVLTLCIFGNITDYAVANSGTRWVTHFERRGISTSLYLSDMLQGLLALIHVPEYINYASHVSEHETNHDGCE